MSGVVDAMNNRGNIQLVSAKAPEHYHPSPGSPSIADIQKFLEWGPKDIQGKVFAFRYFKQSDPSMKEVKMRQAFTGNQCSC